MKECAILMSSCDAYEDLWDPFFESLNIMWDNLTYPVYLNTEHKEYIPRKRLNFEVKTLTQCDDRRLPWSMRFIQAINRIPEEYIFLVLDDFFVCDKVDKAKIDEIIAEMEKDPSIASFQLCGTRTRNANPEEYQQQDFLTYSLMERRGWKTHFVPTVWRKSVLLKWLRPWESIWAFEDCGSKRARRWNYPEKVYVVTNPPIYDYLWIKDCSAVINGKWLAEEELLNFFSENHIEIDWSKRGKMTYQEYQDITFGDVIKKYTFSQLVEKSINRVRSFF